MATSHEPLTSSQLGTKAYWDAAYSRELTNLAADSSDHGTSWFAENGAEDKLVGFLTEDLQLAPATTSFLDVGTGNGEMLRRLREEGFGGRMVGVDYSASSIALASGIGGGEGEGAEGLEFRVWDVMREEHEEEEQEKEWMGGGFDVVLDKGTFDAISLSGDVEGGRRVFEQYPGRIVRLVRPGGLFIVTSCNWTGEEILSLFNVPGLRPHVPGEIRYPSFRFGGSSGQSICTKVFERC